MIDTIIYIMILAVLYKLSRDTTKLQEQVDTLEKENEV